MTKILAILCAAVLTIAGLTATLTTGENSAANEPIDAPVEDIVEDIVEMTGTVLEVTDSYYLIENADGQQVQVNLYEETVFEGQDPSAGDLIHVLYNGMMTRSLPPQINALRIGCYVRSGAVVELTETGFTLDDGNEILEVHADAALLQGLETGDNVLVYFNGAMTMSLPAQIGAEMIVPYQAE